MADIEKMQPVSTGKSEARNSKFEAIWVFEVSVIRISNFRRRMHVERPQQFAPFGYKTPLFYL
jgi:hypothetical protein